MPFDALLFYRKSIHVHIHDGPKKQGFGEGKKD